MRTEKWLFFVPLSVFLIAANSSFMYWFNRKKEYRTIAANKVLRNVTTAGLNMGIGVINAGAAGLIVGQMSGDAITTGIFGMHFFRKNKLTRWYFSHKTLAATAFEYRDFPLFSLPATFLDTLSIQAPIMLISRWFTERLTGYYFFAFRIMSAPMALLGAAVAQTFYQKFTEIIQAGGIGAKRFLLRIWLNLFLIAVVPITVIFFFGPSLFQFVFGAGWEESGKIASILAPYILISFISSPTSTTYMVLRMQNISFIFSVIALCYRLMAIFIGYYLGDFFMGLKILVACELIQIVIYNYIIYRKL